MGDENPIADQKFVPVLMLLGFLVSEWPVENILLWCPIIVIVNKLEFSGK